MPRISSNVEKISEDRLRNEAKEKYIMRSKLIQQNLLKFAKYSQKEKRQSVTLIKKSFSLKMMHYTCQGTKCIA